MKKQVLGIVIAVFLCLALIMPSLADQIVLPSDTTVIEDEAFFGDQSLTELVLPEGLLRIGSKAFASTSLHSVVFPRSLQYFAQDAFDFSAEGFEFYVYEGSDAAQLCVEYGLHPKVIGENKVGVSMPTNDLVRWEMDGANLKSILEGYGYEVDLQYASYDVPTQVAQVESMIDNGARVVVIAAIQGSALGETLNKAAENGVKVIAYDRLLMDSENVDYYVTFDNYKVGTVQGNYVKNALNLDSATGPFNIEFTAGDPGDNNASYFFNGAMDVLKPYIQSGKLIVQSGQTSFSSVATSGWNPATAQKRAEDILSAFYYNGTELDAWVCSNDTTALGVTNALKSIYNGKWPIITGQDCDLPNVKNIIAGKQAMSVFKDTRILAAQAAKMVKQIMNGEAVDVNDTETYNNNSKYVPTYLCAPVFCDANNYRELLIDSGYYTEEALSGGSSDLPDEKIKIGIINLDPSESAYREANVRSLNDTFTAENGYDAVFATAATIDKQLEAAQGFIDDGVKYIAICAAEAYGWDEVLQEANETGIRVFLYDRMIDCNPSLYTAAIVSDMAEEGITAVNWLKSLNLSEYKILHIQGYLGSDAQVGRSAALNDQVASNNNWTFVCQESGYWQSSEAKAIVSNAIRAGKDFNVIYAENEGMARGAVEALDEVAITHGVGGKVIIMSFDCNKWALRKLLAGEWNYDGQCSPFQAPYIDSMIKTLEAGGTITGLNNLNQFITPEIGFDARTITQEDIDTYGLGD